MMKEKDARYSSFPARRWALSLLAHLILLFLFSFVYTKNGLVDADPPRDRPLSLRPTSSLREFQPAQLALPTSKRFQPQSEQIAAQALLEPKPIRESERVKALLSKYEREVREREAAQMAKHPPILGPKLPNQARPIAPGSPQLIKRIPKRVTPSTQERVEVTEDQSGEPVPAVVNAKRTSANIKTDLTFPRSLKRRFRGEVEWELSLSQSGKVTGLKMIRGTGDEYLDSLVKNVLRGASFEPARIGDEPVSSELTLVVEVR